MAVGYGKSATRFTEEKRAVSNKDLGPLVATEMTRCIHCSRCVRFTDEVAGYQELGMSYRNNHVEVMPFIGKTVNSELSGNIIDICPVGALTSKPFRNQYRAWELSRRKSIAAHDGLGSNIIVQVDKYHKVVRVLPLENEALNECWLSDRDRFSYEGLYHTDRVTTPMIKQDGKWHNVDWATAINYAAKTLTDIKDTHGADAIGVLASNTSTTEELYLLQKMMRAFGVNNLDSRLHQTDFTLDGKQQGALYLGDTIANFATSKSILVIGSILREEQPLLAHRIRDAVKRGATLNVINVLTEDLLCNVTNQVMTDPRELAYFLAQVVKATLPQTGSTAATTSTLDLTDVVVSPEATKIAQSLNVAGAYIVLGAIAQSLPNYAEITLLTQQLAENVQGKFGYLIAQANTVGADLVGFVPYHGAFNQQLAQIGLNTEQMLTKPRNAYVLLHTELEHDAYNSALALNALQAANSVIVMSAFAGEAMKKYADVILPITPYTETAGSFVNMEGVWQQFNGVTRPLGEAKPAWKLIRVLANALSISGFEYDNIEDVRSELVSLKEPALLLNNAVTSPNKTTISKPELKGLVRFGLQGIYNGDSITRRATALQHSYYGQLPTMAINRDLALELNISGHLQVTLNQADSVGSFSLSISNDIPDTVVLLAHNAETCGFAGRYDSIEINV